jgi:hypothetical protein
MTPLLGSDIMRSQQDSSYCADIGIVFLGPFFTGAYLHQKLDLAPPLERERYSVQKHVLSY